MPTINPERLLEDLRHLATFGKVDTGVRRLSLSPEDMAARRWLVERMTDAGLDASIDGVGNVLGHSTNSGKALLVGSHSDSQPRGGWLDGALGVIYGLETARALRESRETWELAVDVVSFVDEESTFCGCLGSRTFCGLLTTEEFAGLASRLDGWPLSDAINEAGLSGIQPARLRPERHAAYLEAHIEQGPYLESDGNSIGVVTSIVGIRLFEICFTGQANHAGTTPMHLRKDAGVSLIRFADRLHTAFEQIAGPKTVWTIGRVCFDPGAPSIIPGRSELTLQFRDPQIEKLDELETKLRELVATADCADQAGVSITRTGATPPAVMDADLQQHVAAAADQHAPGKWMRMPSAAGHDAMILAEQLPSAMLFVPSIGGISHDFAEDTNQEDIVLGGQVMATAAASILLAMNGEL